MMLDHPSRSLPAPVQHTLPSAGAAAGSPAPPHPHTVITTTSYCPIKDIAVMHNRFFPDTFPNTLTTTTLQNRRTASKLPSLDDGSRSTTGTTENPLSPSYRSSSLPGSLSPPQTPNANDTAAPQSTSSVLPPPDSPSAPTHPNPVSSTSTSSSSRLKLRLTNQFFTEKSDIKPWIQSRLSSLGINIVIERSDDTKIVFKCKYSFSQPRPSSSAGAAAAANSPSSRKKKFCPFRIRANYSIRLKHWSLVIVNDSHNHPLPLVNIEDVQDKLSEENSTNCDNSNSSSNNENNNNYTHTPSSIVNAADEEKQHPAKRVKRSTPGSKIAISPLPLPPSITISAARKDDSSAAVPAKPSSMLTLSSDMTRKSSGSVDSLLNTDSNSSSNSNNNIPNKLPPLTSCTQLPANNMDYHLRQPHFFQSQHLDPAYRIQVKRIEDTLRGLEKIDSITEDSKEKIFSNVLSVLNNSISEAAKPATAVLASPPPLTNSDSNSSSSSSISAFNLGKIINNPPSVHSPSLGSTSTHQSFKYTPAPLHTRSFDPATAASAPLPSPPHAQGKLGETIILPSLDVLKRGLDNNVDSHGKPHNNHRTISLGYNSGIGKGYI